jgi:hypothetical protein
LCSIDNRPISIERSVFAAHIFVLSWVSILRNNCIADWNLLTPKTKIWFSIEYYIITLRIQALSLVDSQDLLEDRRTELRHTKPYPIAFPYLYRSCTCDICKISTVSNFQMFGWIKNNLFTCLIWGFSFYYIKQIDEISPSSVQL